MRYTTPAFLGSALLFCSFGASPIEAASLTVLKGQLLVSEGGGYHQVGNTELKPGDSVLANPGGFGTIDFGNGCIVNIDQGSVFTVPDAPPCTAAVSPEAATASGLGNPTTLLIGAAAIGGVAAVVTVAAGGSSGSSGGGDNGGGGGNPSSP